MGNRGILHNENQEILSTHKIQGWVTCLLEFKGRKRELMSKGRYTELFFFDEATAFSAGHRPCAECRRARFKEFKEKWLEANETLLDGQKQSIGNIDKIIHRQRINRKIQVTYEEQCNRLPQGTMVKIDSNPYIIWNDALYKWSFEGYAKSDILIDKSLVTVLTPKSYVEMFKKGFMPEVHSTLLNLLRN